jgi:hypothetical protein
MSDNELKIRDLRGAVRDAVSEGNRPTTPMDLLRVAMEKGIDPDKLKVFVDMAEKFQAEARKAAFYDALARARSSPPDILKNKLMDHELKGGGRRTYRYPTHDEVALKVADWMAPFGLAVMWIPSQSKGMVTITCRITHSAGHHEDFTLSAPEDMSGLKTPIQAIASTKTYLERYTLLGGLGLSSRELGAADVDGSDLPKVPDAPPTMPPVIPPPDYPQWRANMELRAKNGLIDLQDAWKTSARPFKAYCVSVPEESLWWEHLKKQAADAPPQGDEAIPM